MTVKIIRVLAVLSGVVCACSPALAKDALMPTVVTETVRNDSDDPAICIDTIDASKSLIIGTDKGDTTGGLYVYDLLGHIDTARTRVPMKRTNNVDIVSGVMLGGYLWQYQLTDAGNIARRESGRVRRVQWQERNRIHRRRPTVGIRVLLRRNRWHSEVLGGPRSRRCRKRTGVVRDDRVRAGSRRARDLFNERFHRLSVGVGSARATTASISAGRKHRCAAYTSDHRDHSGLRARNRRTRCDGARTGPEVPGRCATVWHREDIVEQFVTVYLGRRMSLAATSQADVLPYSHSCNTSVSRGFQA